MHRRRKIYMLQSIKKQPKAYMSFNLVRKLCFPGKTKLLIDKNFKSTLGTSPSATFPMPQIRCQSRRGHRWLGLHSPHKYDSIFYRKNMRK